MEKKRNGTYLDFKLLFILAKSTQGLMKLGSTKFFKNN